MSDKSIRLAEDGEFTVGGDSSFFNEDGSLRITRAGDVVSEPLRLTGTNGEYVNEHWRLNPDKIETIEDVREVLRVWALSYHVYYVQSDEDRERLEYVRSSDLWEEVK